MQVFTLVLVKVKEIFLVVLDWVLRFSLKYVLHSSKKYGLERLREVPFFGVSPYCQIRRYLSVPALELDEFSKSASASGVIKK